MTRQPGGRAPGVDRPVDGAIPTCPLAGATAALDGEVFERGQSAFRRDGVAFDRSAGAPVNERMAAHPRPITPKMMMPPPRTLAPCRNHRRGASFPRQAIDGLRMEVLLASSSCVCASDRPIAPAKAISRFTLSPGSQPTLSACESTWFPLAGPRRHQLRSTISADRPSHFSRWFICRWNSPASRSMASRTRALLRSTVAASA